MIGLLKGRANLIVSALVVRLRAKRRAFPAENAKHPNIALGPVLGVPVEGADNFGWQPWDGQPRAKVDRKAEVAEFGHASVQIPIGKQNVPGGHIPVGKLVALQVAALMQILQSTSNLDENVDNVAYKNSGLIPFVLASDLFAEKLGQTTAREPLHGEQ